MYNKGIHPHFAEAIANGLFELFDEIGIKTIKPKSYYIEQAKFMDCAKRKFGVTWCVKCGRLFTKPCGKELITNKNK